MPAAPPELAQVLALLHPPLGSGGLQQEEEQQGDPPPAAVQALLQAVSTQIAGLWGAGARLHRGTGAPSMHHLLPSGSLYPPCSMLPAGVAAGKDGAQHRLRRARTRCVRMQALQAWHAAPAPGTCGNS